MIRKVTHEESNLKGLLIGGLLTGSAGVVARGYYEFIPYYGNDPFLFCTLGVPTDCWAPISAATGTFVVTNYYCFNAVSAAQFARVCPHAFIPEASIHPSHRTSRVVADDEIKHRPHGQFAPNMQTMGSGLMPETPSA